LRVSAIEWIVSASIAAEPVSSAATALATAMSRFAATATTTVRRLASSVSVTAPLDARAAVRRPGWIPYRVSPTT
jgi:hypothetical protein